MAEAITKGVHEVWYNAGNRPWKLTQKPFKLAPNVYYVGNTWVGAFLIDTEEGLILIDTTTFETVYLVLEAIRDLGFDPHNIRHIMLTHCHIDHSGGVNQIKTISNAKVWMSREDTSFKDHPANLTMGNEFKIVDFEVDEFLDDHTEYVFGSTRIRTVLTPGHTPGTTSFFITVPGEDGKDLVLAIHGGVGPNTMNDEYYEKYGLPKSLRSRFIRDCEELKKEHVDITVPSHPAHGDLFKNLDRDNLDNYRTLVDPDEWSRFLDVRKKFAEQLEK